MKTNTHNVSVPIAIFEGDSEPGTQAGARTRPRASPSRAFQTAPALVGLATNRSTIQTAQPPRHRKPLRRLMSAIICGASRANSVHEVKAMWAASAADLRSAAAYLADATTDSRHPLHLDLSSAMCRAAVKLCATMAGLSLHAYNAQHGLVSQADRQIDGPQAMTDLPVGHVIGSFDGDRLIHAMIGIGSGCAAGNKNDCIGMGNPIGWESLDLRNLKWDMNGTVLAPGLLKPERTLVIRSRALGDV